MVLETMNCTSSGEVGTIHCDTRLVYQCFNMCCCLLRDHIVSRNTKCKPMLETYRSHNMHWPLSHNEGIDACTCPSVTNQIYKNDMM